MDDVNSAEEPHSSTIDDIEDELPRIQEHEADEVIILEESDAATAQANIALNEQEGSHDENDDDDKEMSTEDASNAADEPMQDDAVLVLREHTSEVLSVAASPSNKKYIITGGMDDIGLIWDLELQQSVATVDGGKDSVSTVAFSNDGKYAAFASENGALSIVYMDGSAAPGTPLDGPGDTIHFLSWHPRGPVLLAGSGDNVAYMWNAAKYSFMMAFAGHEDAVTCGGFTGDGKLVLTGSNDSSVRIWNPTSGETMVRIQTGVAGLRGVFHAADILCLTVGAADTPADKLVASGCAAGDIFISHRETGQIVGQLPRHEGGVECVVFCPNRARPMFLASAGADGVVRVWDVEMSTERCKFTHGGVISKVVWHSELPVLASSSSDGTVAVWNVLSGQQIVCFKGHSSFIADFCFTDDFDFIASASADGTVRIFDVRLPLSSVK